MGSTRILCFFYPILIQLLVLTVAQPNELQHFCLDRGNFTTNSTYKSNLDNLLTSLSSSTEANYGFFNDSFGRNTDKVNAIALCRGDKKPDTCRSCINNSTQEITRLCPNQKEAIIWYDDCMLRYSNRSIFRNMEIGPSFWMYNLNNVSEVNEFDQELKNLLENLTSQAASGGSLRKFATGNVTTSSEQTIYALVQCTPDLSMQECSNCLTNATGLIPQCCYGRQGGRVVSPSCNFRYEKDIFYDPAATVLTPTPAPLPMLPPPPMSLPTLPPPPQATPVPPPPTPTAGTTGMTVPIAEHA